MDCAVKTFRCFKVWLNLDKNAQLLQRERDLPLTCII